MPGVIINFIKEDFMNAMTSPTIIITSLIVGWLVYLTTKRYYKRIMKRNAYDKAYPKFTDNLSYAIARLNGYVSNLDPGNKKYTEVGVRERMNEVKAARLQLLSACGKHVRVILLEAGNEWLDDIESFGKTAPLIMKKLAELEFKDRN